MPQTYYESPIYCAPSPSPRPSQPQIIHIQTESEDKGNSRRLEKVEQDLTLLKDQLKVVTEQLTNIATLTMEMKHLLSRKNKSLEKQLKEKDAVLNSSLQLNNKLGMFACESSDESDNVASVQSSKGEE